MDEPYGPSTGDGTNRFRRRLTRRSLVAGVVTAMLVVCIGVALLVFRSQTWTATSSLLILPNTAVVDQSSAASYYDTLSQGQIPTTFAQILQSKGTSALSETTGVSTDEARRATVTVTAVPDTSIIDVQANAATREQAALVADGVARAGQRTLQLLDTPYTASIVNRPTPGLAQPVGPSALMMALVTAVVAVVAGVGAQQTLWLFGATAARRSAPARTARRGEDHAFVPAPASPPTQQTSSVHRSGPQPAATAPRGTRTPYRPDEADAGTTTARQME